MQVQRCRHYSRSSLLRLRASKCGNTAQIEYLEFLGILKGKSTLMIYNRHPELQSKWDKAFETRGYYVAIIGNITDETVQKYIKEQAEDSRISAL